MPVLVLRLLALATLFVSLPLRAEPVEFNVPAQRANNAILTFASQAKSEVLFSYDELRQARSSEVRGRFEPEEALNRLLTGTGFIGKPNGPGKFVVSVAPPPAGTIKGRITLAGGLPASGVRVAIARTRRVVTTKGDGAFEFADVAPGTHRVIASAPGYSPAHLGDAQIESGSVVTLEHELQLPSNEPQRLDPYIVEGTAAPSSFDRKSIPPGPRTATGNLDLHRDENGALPFLTYDREQITRSGVVNLNEFLQRELLDTDAASRPPEQNGDEKTYITGSTNLGLRGYGTEETVVLVNGRRLPEILTSGQGAQPPDVNMIPLSLVQQIQVLPVSASALYSGNPVGGVINIVLRPDVDANANEMTATYTNALGGFDAPQSALSFLHASSLLRGRLRIRLNATFTRAVPPTEAELGHHSRRGRVFTAVDDDVYRATPNIRSAALAPLFGPGSSAITSVAPGANGGEGLAALRAREGGRSLDFFQSPGRFAASQDSIDFPYGRRQTRSAYFGSVVFDALPWLQVGLDATYAQTIAHRGFDVLAARLPWSGDSPFNPFGQDVIVTLNETAPALGENYSEARLEFGSGVLGVMVKLPADWRVSADAQYAHSYSKYRGLAGADLARWQDLLETGRYNPLRDTQVHPPPQEFYDRVLVYRGNRGSFVTLGDYNTLDLSLRALNEALRLPTGRGVVNVGGDYRRNQFQPYTDRRRFADGTLASEPTEYTGRTLGRYSVFGELQAPLLPKTWLPRPIRALESNIAVRYVAADTSRETNVAPTFGAKVEFAGGLSFRGSFTTSSRYPTPHMSREVLKIQTGVIGLQLDDHHDPVRRETYGMQVTELINPDLLPEEAVTQTAGLLFQRGKNHRVRIALDFVDTRKTNELVNLDAPTVINLEPLRPERVLRALPTAGDPNQVGRITDVFTGTTNLSWRQSQNWNASFNYAWPNCAGGTLELYSRLLYFQKFRVQSTPGSEVSDELKRPVGAARGVLRYRANFGASWENRRVALGFDGHYFHSRLLPVIERPAQGRRSVPEYWQFDVYGQTDLGDWLPWDPSRLGLRLHVRVNNVFGWDYPKYVNGPSGAGVQPYGDWRGRVYSVSVTASF